MSAMMKYMIFSFSVLVLVQKSYSAATSEKVKMPVPSLTFSWLDDKSTFQTGEMARIKINLLQSSLNGSNTVGMPQNPINVSLFVNGKQGNSSYISGVHSFTGGDPSFWNITFIPLLAGEFSLVVTEIHFGVIDSSLHFSVKPGHLYPSACVASWADYNAIESGARASLLILPKDAFGNNVTLENATQTDQCINLSVSYENGSTVPLSDFRNNGWNKEGYISLDFVLTISGNFLVHVFSVNIELRDSPLPFTVKPGPLDLTKSVGKWKYGTNAIRIFSKLEILIYQKDLFGNLVPGLHPFDARITKKSSNLSIPVPDLSFQELEEGIQLLSFTAKEEGQFVLTVFDANMNSSVSNMVYEYSVFIGYCDGSRSFANGTGLALSVAGRVSSFNVFLLDQHNNSSPVMTERLHVQLVSSLDGLFIRPIVFPMQNRSEKVPSAGGDYFSKSKSSGSKDEIIIGNPGTRASDFSISYRPKKSGEYQIRVFCGNVQINNGQPYLMKVSPGIVDISKSNIIKYETHVKRAAKSEVLVQLLDSFRNPAISSRAKLSFQITTTNGSSFVKYPFTGRENGLYLGYFEAREIGSYDICVLFMEKTLSPCPVTVQVHEDEYFSMANDDPISVWEDESVSVDVLSNDYIPAKRANLADFSLPKHGSLLRYGDSLQYTPYKGYFGNDSFNYTIFDINNNTSTGTVLISVLCKPPQFVSLPAQLRTSEEDSLSPKFGGLEGIKMIYSDAYGNISVTIKAQSGTIFLAPISMQFLEPNGSVIAVNRGGTTGNDLVLTGQLEAINLALQSLQYLTNDNFYGNDVITLYAMNENGVQDAAFSVFVQPINDAPIIHAPKSIFIGGKESKDGFLIFDEQQDTFEFSIDDPDFVNFAGNKSDFQLIFSLEVDEGELLTTLPVSILGSTEIKSETRKVWQPIQTYVTNSNRFVIRGKGIRFRSGLLHCNNALHQLFYEGENDETILTLTVIDLGNYGCYPDCVSMMSAPLSTETNIRLNKRRTTNPRQTLLIVWAIFIEILMMLVLGGILLYFMCRCMNDVYDTRRDSDQAASS